MGNKNSRSGGKYTNNHTTLIPLSAVICDLVYKCEEVSKISPGYISSLSSIGGNRRIKISDSISSLLLTVRGNTSCQEIRVYSSDLQKTKLYIENECKKLKIDTSFR